MSDDPRSCLEYAKKYASLGFSVIPIKARDKKPALSSWSQYQDRRAGESEIDDWFSEEDKHNIGIVCGKVSNNLIVLDFDDPRAAFYCFPELMELAENTPVARTGKGIHIYLRTTQESKKTTFQRRKEKKWLPLDVQADGGYVVAPPSIHSSGRRYEFLNEPKDIMEVDWLEKLKFFDGKAEEWGFVEKILPAWVEGNRQNLAMGVAGLLRKRFGYDLERTKKVIRGICAATDDNEISARISAAEATYGKEVDDVAVAGWFGEGLSAELYKIADEIAIKSKKVEPRDFFEKDEDGNVTKILAGKIGEYIAVNYPIITLRDTQEILFFKEGYYHEEGEVWVQERVKDILGPLWKTVTVHQVDEIIFHVKSHTFKDYEIFTADPYLLPVSNGVLNIKARELTKYDPEKHFFLFKLPVNYDPSANCPEIDKVVKEILDSEADISRAYETAGFCLHGDYFLKKAVLFDGGGNNGKSILLTIIIRMLGEKNISSVPLQRLEEDRFAKGELRGKLANICGDISDRSLKETSTFKILTGGDPIHYDKKFRHGGQFVNRAKLIQSANRLPDARDDSDAFFDRWELMFFPFEFVNIIPDAIGAEKKYKMAGKKEEILAKTTTDQELSGLLNRSLDALDRLIKNNSFTDSKSVQDNRAAYLRKASALKAFILEDCVTGAVEGEEIGILKEEFYSKYLGFCTKYGLNKLAKNIVGRDLPKLFPGINIEDHRQTQLYGEKFASGREEYVWIGVDLKKDIEKRIEKARKNRGGENSGGNGKNEEGLNAFN